MAWTGPERWGNDDLFSGNTPASAALILPEVCEMPDNAGESSLLEGLRLGPRGHAGLIKTDQKKLQEEKNQGSGQSLGLGHSRG